MTVNDFSTLSALVIDDSGEMVTLIKAFLEHAGFASISTARNGQEALDLLQAGKTEPDIILCDLEMPVLNGKEFVAALRGDTDSAFSTTPVVLLTGSSEGDNINDILKLGIHGHAVKPVTLEDLLACITHALTSPAIDPSETGS